MIRRVLAQLSPRTLRGTVLAVPIVNVLGTMRITRAFLPALRQALCDFMVLGRRRQHAA